MILLTLEKAELMVLIWVLILNTFLENEIKYGIEVNGFTTYFNFFNSVGRKIEQQNNTTELAGYVDGKIVKGLLIINPSFRAQYYASLRNFSPEPRLGLKYNITENLELKQHLDYILKI